MPTFKKYCTMPIMKKPRILNTEICAKSNIFTIEALDLEFSNGVTTQYERIKGSGRGAVLIVPVQNNGDVLLIREYAVGVERYELALPKGKIDANESILAAASRELKEEVGFGAKKLTHLTSYTIAPSYLTHTTHIVLAEELYPEKLLGDEPEPIIVESWSFDDLDKLIALPDMSEARSIAALYQVRDLLNARKY